MNKSTSFILLISFIVFTSCNNQKAKNDINSKSNNDTLKTVYVSKHLHDSLYHLCDSLASNIQSSAAKLDKMDRKIKRKDFNATDDFYMVYEGNMQNVFGSVNKMDKMDSLLEASGIYIFNYKLFQSADQALSLIDSIEKINPKMDDFHKKSLKIEKEKMVRMKGVKYVFN